MNADIRRGAPPQFLQRMFGTMLPPDRREQVLGDLEERYRATDGSRASLTTLVGCMTLSTVVARGHARKIQEQIDALDREWKAF